MTAQRISGFHSFSAGFADCDIQRLNIPAARHGHMSVEVAMRAWFSEVGGGLIDFQCSAGGGPRVPVFSTGG
jgi:hypothetical protein